MVSGAERELDRHRENKSSRETHCKLRTKGRERGEGRNRQNKKIFLSREPCRRTSLKKEGEKRGGKSRKKVTVTFDPKPPHSLTLPPGSHLIVAVAAHSPRMEATSFVGI